MYAVYNQAYMHVYFLFFLKKEKVNFISVMGHIVLYCFFNHLGAGRFCRP